MNKALQIKLMQRLLKKHGIEPDTVDLEALIDSNLTFTENKKLIFEQLGITEKQRMLKEDEIRETLNQAYEWHQTRSEKAKQTDESRLAKIPENPDRWFKYPHRYDLPGVDAPGFAEDYIRYLKAKGSAKKKILAELKEKEPAQLKKLEKKRKKEQKENEKRLKYIKEHFDEKMVFIYDFRYDYGNHVGESRLLGKGAELIFFLRAIKLRERIIQPEILFDDKGIANLADEVIKFAFEKDTKLKQIIDNKEVCKRCIELIKLGKKACDHCYRGIYFYVYYHRRIYIPKRIKVLLKYVWYNPDIMPKEARQEQDKIEEQIKKYTENKDLAKDEVRAVFRLELNPDLYIKGRKGLIGMDYVLGRYFFFDEIVKLSQEIPDPSPKYYLLTVVVDYKIPPW